MLVCKPGRREHLLQDSSSKDNTLPAGFFVDQGTRSRLMELCREMGNSCGMVECTLQLALESEGEKQVVFIKNALRLAVRATRSLKLFLSEWRVITQDQGAEIAADNSE